MRILFITNSPIEYSSSANIRNTALIKGFIENGHDIDILTCYPDKSSKYYDSTIANNLNLAIKYIDRADDSNEQELENIKYKSSNLYHKVRNNLYKLYNALSIYDPRKRNLRLMDNIEINESYDVVISSSDPKSSHLIAEKIVERLKVTKWIQYWGDPLTTDINKNAIIPKFILKNEELRLLEKASEAFYVSPITLKLQKEMFKEISGKIHYLPIPIQINGYDEKTITINDNIKIGYYGDYFSRDRNIIPLVNACEKSDFCLEIFGSSDVKITDKDNIQVNERAPFEVIKMHEKNTDILVCLCNKKGGQIPGKIYHYAATNKPILLILDGDYQQTIHDWFGKYPNYFICKNDENSIRETIMKINNSKLKLSPIKDFASTSIALNMVSKLDEIGDINES